MLRKFVEVATEYFQPVIWLVGRPVMLWTLIISVTALAYYENTYSQAAKDCIAKGGNRYHFLDGCSYFKEIK